jgi:hypothetical protein
MFVGRVYKIWAGDRVYVGSTRSTLRQTLQAMQAKYRAYQQGRGDYITVFEVLAHGGEIELLEEDEYEDSDQMHDSEKFFMNQYHTVNRYAAIVRPRDKTRTTCAICGINTLSKNSKRHFEKKHQ